MKIPASRRKLVSLKLGIHDNEISLVPGPYPYLFVGVRGKQGGCLGSVKDSHVKKLRDMCNEILDRRELEEVRTLSQRKKI